jgi:peroxiredoxin
VEKVSFEAIDCEVTLSDGSARRLSSFWQHRPLALVFPRFFGCPFGRRQILQLRQERDALRNAGIDVVLVSSGTPAQAEVFRRDYRVPFTVICDPDRVLFRTYSLREMTLRDYLSPRMYLKSVQVMMQGYGHKSGEGSEAQLGGVFIIDTNGKVAYAHIAADAADHPSPQEILQAAATLRPKVEARATDRVPALERGNPVTGATREASMPPEVITSGRTMAFIAYVFFPIPLFAGVCRRNAFVMHHTRQAIPIVTLGIASVVIAMSGAAASSRTSPITIGSYVLYAAIVALLVVGGVHALRGEVKPLPLLGRLADSLRYLQ